MAREFCYTILCGSKLTDILFRVYRAHTEVDAAAVRAMSRYPACSVLSVQLPPVTIIAEANKLAVKYLISLHTDACCGVLTHFSSWK